MRERHQVGPVWFDVGPFGECVDHLVSMAALGEPAHVHFANAYTIALADTQPQYARLLNSGLTFTDGVPVAWVGRRAYGMADEQWPRVYGPDVMEAVLARPEPVRHYLLGGSAETLTALQREIGCRWPGAVVVGAESPPFRALSAHEQEAQDGRIAAAKAQAVWVGLGTPKQDWEVARLSEELGVVALAVGAAFDFIAGTKPQAPLWMQRSGTEWAYRLAHEPRRLARRYVWGNPRFLVAAARTPGLARKTPR